MKNDYLSRFALIPSEQTFKKTFENYDELIKSFKVTLKQYNTRIENLSNETNDELDRMNKKISSLNFNLEQKADMPELTKIWDYFKRFAEYNDLKHLHNLLFTEIEKFESRIMEFKRSIKGQEMIIQNFDEIIQTKNSKISHEELFNYVKEKCINRSEVEEFLKSAKE